MSESPSNLTVAEMFVRCLEAEGVRYVFGVPGEENEDLLFALEKSSVQFIPTRHEQGAAFMADVWGRITGQAGVCLSTLGPGATNLLTGVADAFLDKSPLVAITGQADRERLHTESHQAIDIVRMFRPITKWNAALTDPDVVADIVRKAFKEAEMEKPGATHIELSEDIAKLPATGRPLRRVKLRRPAPDSKALDQAVTALVSARRPLILAGNGAIRKLASRHLRRFVERHEIPVLHTFMGKGAVSWESPQSLLSIGLGFRDLCMKAVDQADLIVTIGYDIAEYAPKKWNPQADKTIVHMDFTPADVFAHYQPAVEVVCDISAALWHLNERLADRHVCVDKDWYRPLREEILADIRSYELKDTDALTIPGTIYILNELMREDDLLISDVGSHKMWIARNYLTRAPNGCLISNGLASMGMALPGAVAASLQNPERRIVAAMGDGGFLMNSQEIETARRLGCRFVMLIFNDNDYGLISWKQQMSQGRSTGTRISNPDFKAYAESFGIRGERPESASELKAVLKDVLEKRELCCVEVPVDTRVNGELIEKLKEV